MAVAFVLFLIIVATVVFHFLSPWQFTELASNWGTIDDTFYLTLVITGIVFLMVSLFMVYSIWKYRARPGHKAHYEPESPKLEAWLTGLTTIGVAAMLAPGLIVWEDYVNVPEGADEFEVVGQQWMWMYRFPGADGKLGTTDIKYINDDNIFGVNPDDPNGRDDILIDDSEVHLPIHRPVKFLLRSTDVLHDFYVPQFRAKMDLVPGIVTYFWVEPTRTGTFEVLCAELCGVNHHYMRGYVVVDEQEDYEAWLADWSTFEEVMADSGSPLADLPQLVDRETTITAPATGQ